MQYTSHHLSVQNLSIVLEIKPNTIGCHWTFCPTFLSKFTPFFYFLPFEFITEISFPFPASPFCGEPRSMTYSSFPGSWHIYLTVFPVSLNVIPLEVVTSMTRKVKPSPTWYPANCCLYFSQNLWLPWVFVYTYIACFLSVRSVMGVVFGT